MVMFSLDLLDTPTCRNSGEIKSQRCSTIYYTLESFGTTELTGLYTTVTFSKGFW